MSSLVPPRRTATLAACLALGLSLPLPLGAQPQPGPQPPKTDTTRGLSIQYADGRISTGPVRRSGGMWTPVFPTIAGADTSRQGIPLTTLDVKHAIDGSDVVVTVTLFYGGPGRHGVTVATVRLSGEQPVEVNELRAYGVEPIVLSLVPIAASVAYVPGTISASPQLEVRAEAIGANVSAYRVIVTNRSALPLMWLQFKAYRGNQLSILGRPRGKRNLPLVLPGAEYSFEVTTSTGGLDSADGSERWQALDRIEVTAVMWQDGVAEGDPASAVEQHRIDQIRATQLRELVAQLRGAPGQSIGNLREHIAQAMSADLETRRARDSLLQDLDAFIAAGTPPDAPEFLAWLTRTLTEYQQWLARIVQSGADAPAR
jgi:hypothetical protein